MKKLFLLLIFTFNISFLYGQKEVVIHMNNWDSPVAFDLSTPPLIIGYGPESENLSKIYNVQFYFYDNNYYKISSWADYYLWYTQKYHFEFTNPELYQNSYDNGDNLAMIKFIKGNIKTDRFPSVIILSTSMSSDKWVSNDKSTEAIGWNNKKANRNEISSDLKNSFDKEETYSQYISNKNKSINQKNSNSINNNFHTKTSSRSSYSNTAKNNSKSSKQGESLSK